MKKYIVLLLLILSTSIKAQQLVQVGTGEYSTTYRYSNNQVYTTVFGTPPTFVNFGLSNVTDLDGAQYTSICIANGKAVEIGKVNEIPFTKTFDTTNLGQPFKPIKVYGFWQSYFGIDSIGRIYYWNNCNVGTAAADPLHQQAGALHTPPTLLTMPVGKTFTTKLAFGTTSTFSTATLWAIATDSTVWEWTQASTTPSQVHFSGDKAIKIGMCWGDFNKVVLTPTDLIGWCVSPTNFAKMLTTGANGNTTPTSIKSAWTNAGCVFPIKEMACAYSGMRIIDANDNLFTSGCNSNGENATRDALNNLEYTPYRTRPSGAGGAWHWNLNVNSNSIDSVLVPKQVLGAKMKNLQTNTTIAFYMYGQDLGGNWYSWGRNKSMCLGNGITLNINDYSDFPNNLDVPAPRIVSPLTQTWTVVNKDTGAVQKPRANAGVNQYITTTSTTLYGYGSSQQEGTITTYAWSQVSGASCTIVSPSSMNTNITGLANGVYVFKLKVTNNNSLKDSINVTVTAAITPTPNLKAPYINVINALLNPLGGVDMTWSGAFDSTVYQFSIQRASSSALSYSPIAYIPCKTTTTNYTFTDCMPNYDGLSGSTTIPPYSRYQVQGIDKLGKVLCSSPIANVSKKN